MPARSRDPEATKTAILAAARLQFGTRGFERTTIRSVASAAAVDPALVMHYFGNKDGLFAAVSRLDIAFPRLTGVPADRVADLLLPVFIGLWGPDGPFLPLLRAASSNRAAADALLDVFSRQVTPALATAAIDQPNQRAALIGAHFVGIAVSRYILGTPPLAGMDDTQLIAWLRPVVAHYLTDPAPEPVSGSTLD
ncbi:MAG: TetR family transcriptional regulator [Mycobacteriaceae bacterium]|nr:TetR family transcriptional regulator [Mycobacteriaceae bacterium]